MRLTLDEYRIKNTIHKNTVPSYGLTLVAGLPFPAVMGDRVRRIQEQLEVSAPGRFSWHGVEHLHTTLFAPLLGQYRDAPPVGRDELPTDLEEFVQVLTDFFAQRQPFALDLAGVHVTVAGLVMVAENNLVAQLASRLRRYPELDPPKHLKGFHVAIGYLNTMQPFSTDEERMRFEQALAQFIDLPVGKMPIQQVWLVHYANRTLNQIVGKLPFTLGKANVITVERLLRELGITIA